MKKWINEWRKKIGQTYYDFAIFAAVFLVGKTNIGPLDDLISQIEKYRIPIMGALPGIAVIYSVFQVLGWYTMTQDEQEGVKKRIRNAFVVAFGMDIVIWFALNTTPTTS